MPEIGKINFSHDFISFYSLDVLNIGEAGIGTAASAKGTEQPLSWGLGFLLPLATL